MRKRWTRIIVFPTILGLIVAIFSPLIVATPRHASATIDELLNNPAVRAEAAYMTLKQCMRIYKGASGDHMRNAITLNGTGAGEFDDLISSADDRWFSDKRQFSFYIDKNGLAQPLMSSYENGSGTHFGFPCPVEAIYFAFTILGKPISASDSEMTKVQFLCDLGYRQWRIPQSGSNSTELCTQSGAVREDRDHNDMRWQWSDNNNNDKFDEGEQWSPAWSLPTNRGLSAQQSNFAGAYAYFNPESNVPAGNLGTCYVNASPNGTPTRGYLTDTRYLMNYTGGTLVRSGPKNIHEIINDEFNGSFCRDAAGYLEQGSAAANAFAALVGQQQEEERERLEQQRKDTARGTCNALEDNFWLAARPNPDSTSSSDAFLAYTAKAACLNGNDNFSNPSFCDTFFTVGRTDARSGEGNGNTAANNLISAIAYCRQGQGSTLTVCADTGVSVVQGETCPDPPPATTPGGDTPVEDDPPTPCEQNGGALAWMLCPVLDGISRGLQSVFQWAIDSLFEYEGTVVNDNLREVWGKILPIANIGFAIAFIIVIYAAVTGGKQ